MTRLSLFTKRRIYLDNAAATETDSRVVSSMEPYWSDIYGNPGGIHKEGREARDVVEKARSNISRALGVKSDELVFVSGGTEANNLAIVGAIRTAEENSKLSDLHIITTKIEHPSVLDVFKDYESRGVSVTYLDVDGGGLVSKESVKDALTPNTVLVSIMYVNSEIGTIEPIKEISATIKEYEKEKNTRILFHTDASQAPLFLNCRPHYLGVDLLTIDGQKIYGPKGIGLLFKAGGVKIEPIFRGGSQENGLRPGTENVPLIVGLETSLLFATDGYREFSARVEEIRDYFFKKLETEVEGVQINGSRKHRVANNVNINIDGVDGEFLVVYLDKEGISASTKSACLSKDSSSSYVVSSIREGSLNPVRFTLGKDTTKSDIDRTVKAIHRFIQKFDKS